MYNFLKSVVSRGKKLPLVVKCTERIHAVSRNVWNACYSLFFSASFLLLTAGMCFHCVLPPISYSCLWSLCSCYSCLFLYDHPSSYLDMFPLWSHCYFLFLPPPVWHSEFLPGHISSLSHCFYLFLPPPVWHSEFLPRHVSSVVSLVLPIPASSCLTFRVPAWTCFLCVLPGPSYSCLLLFNHPSSYLDMFPLWSPCSCLFLSDLPSSCLDMFPLWSLCSFLFLSVPVWPSEFLQGYVSVVSPLLPIPACSCLEFRVPAKTCFLYVLPFPLCPPCSFLFLSDLPSSWLLASMLLSLLVHVSTLPLLPVLRIRIRIGSGFNEASGSANGFRIRIRIQEGKNYPQK